MKGEGLDTSVSQIEERPIVIKSSYATKSNEHINIQLATFQLYEISSKH